jgi:hypothetical protein
MARSRNRLFRTVNYAIAARNSQWVSAMTQAEIMRLLVRVTERRTLAHNDHYDIKECISAGLVREHEYSEHRYSITILGSQYIFRANKSLAARN